MNEGLHVTRRVDFASFSVELPPGWKQYGEQVPVNFLEEANMHMRCVNFVDFSCDVPGTRLQFHEIMTDGSEGNYVSNLLRHIQAIESSPTVMPAVLDGVEAVQVWRVDQGTAHTEYLAFKARTGALVFLECHTSSLKPGELASVKGSVMRFLDSWRWVPT